MLNNSLSVSHRRRAKHCTCEECVFDFVAEWYHHSNALSTRPSRAANDFGKAATARAEKNDGQHTARINVGFSKSACFGLFRLMVRGVNNKSLLETTHKTIYTRATLAERRIKMEWGKKTRQNVEQHFLCSARSWVACAAAPI